MKLALRRLFKSPAFALTAVMTVGAAIGANALIFSVVNGIILKPLPYHQPASLVGVWHVAPGVMAGPLNQSAATYFMDSGRGHGPGTGGRGPGGGGPDGGLPAATVRHLPPRNRLGQFRSSTSDEGGDDALAA